MKLNTALLCLSVSLLQWWGENRTLSEYERGRVCGQKEKHCSTMPAEVQHMLQSGKTSYVILHISNWLYWYDLQLILWTSDVKHQFHCLDCEKMLWLLMKLWFLEIREWMLRRLAIMGNSCLLWYWSLICSRLWTSHQNGRSCQLYNPCCKIF